MTKLPIDKTAFEKAGLKVRDSQLEMLRLSGEAFSTGHVAVFEAPTGVGKTLAYLLAALSSRTKNAKIIVSTATIALQEQLLASDIPLAEKILAQKIKAGLAKGRRRYVCLSRLYQADEGDQSFKRELQQRLEARVWDGEKESLSVKLSEAEWQQVSTDQAGCSGHRCADYENCVFYKKRRQVLGSEVIIVNHSLLLADLSLGGGVVLPPLADCLYILDECHHLPEKAVNHWAKQVTLLRSLDWLNTIAKNLVSTALYLPSSALPAEAIQKNTRQLAERLSSLRTHIDTHHLCFKENIWRLNPSDIASFDVLAGDLISESRRLCISVNGVVQALEIAHETAKEVDEEKAGGIANLLSKWTFILERLENVYLTWQGFLAPRAKGEAPFAKWFECKGARQDEPTDYTCHVAPITAGKALYEQFWQQLSRGAVLCSATVSTLGDFKDYLRRAGLAQVEKLVTKKLDSSFDYTQSFLFLPTMSHEPNWQNTKAHHTESAALIAELILKNCGSLILFSSRHALADVYDQLPAALQDLILIQGALGKSALLRCHKRRVDEGHTSVVFGLASFAEGLDLSGRYCEQVIIHKLPFVTPSDPIELTRNDWIKQNKLDAFQVYTLPNTALRLTQYVGRLLRTEADRGIVTILDKRLYTKAYGKQLMADLPPFTRVINQSVASFKAAQVERFSFLSFP